MKTFKSIITLIFTLLVALCIFVGINSYTKFKEAIDRVPLEQKVAEIKGRKNFCSIENIPQFYIDAVVSVEDRRFFDHNGFDFVGTLRAIIVDIKTKSLKEGGSTISQQLAKNMYFPLDNTIERKIAEIFTAIYIENKYSKKEILELYFNCIYYGSGYYCIYDASKGYFRKKPASMNEYESSLLAGIPNAPSVYSPKVNPRLAHSRQEKVLDTMIECKVISETDKQKILKMRSGYKW